ncbi:MAG: ChrR family anti-sigma-E factor [Alphaproteobacteria bacterium]
MTVRHHIGEDTLLAYAAGSTDEATGLIVATHVSICPGCRAALSDAEAVGGALLEDEAPQPLGRNAWAQMLCRLDEGAPGASVTASPTAGMLPNPLCTYLGTGDPAALPWRWIGPGVRGVRVPLRGGRSRAILLRIGAGRTMPAHGHGGIELALVLAGGYVDESGRYRRGDVQEATPEIRHQPTVDPDEPCLCLLVSDAPLRFTAWWARLGGRLVGL